MPELDPLIRESLVVFVRRSEGYALVALHFGPWKGRASPFRPFLFVRGKALHLIFCILYLIVSTLWKYLHSAANAAYRLSLNLNISK